MDVGADSRPRASIPRGLIIAAAASGSGKTTLTLGLLHLLARQGIAARGCKIGPDYIDPAFHAAASGADCFNLDPWAMRPASLAALIDASTPADLLVVEGVMGLFDGAAMPAGAVADILPIGSTAQLAAMTGWPVILVLNVKGQGATAAAVARGMRNHHPGVHIAGVICNNVGGARHVEILRQAFDQLGLPVFGFVPQIAHLALPDRHLGLVQAAEHGDLPRFLQRAADHMATHVEIDRLIAAAQPIAIDSPDTGKPPRALLPPLGQHIAIAKDIAFAFAYSGQLLAWRKAGAELSFFSPLANETAAKTADAIFLPGGYPELHAGKLASNTCFLDGLRDAAARGVTIYGECGGYMVLGRAVTDAEGHRHAMLGLLPLETSFAQRKLHLGYRELRLLAANALGRAGDSFRGHEFHYATILQEDEGGKLFEMRDAQGRELGIAGHRHGVVSGSFMHLIDRR
ncbi:cobyrinate a,c-diamide synthase [Dongia soli]|uniref:Cobyrinate a,c-diamide synthase n=1 Tax=Dongia soli TaxID=600628 RepID=A0ABU5EC45_9PROT|nr:cobyrinate a,c-diamide synthase [Dongia soli]MDY0883859.1 cobyrinate a,c-diamide synthase [Dongia soli]